MTLDTQSNILPPLPDVPCSVNIFFKVDGYQREAQATGRGWTPAQAADNLYATIEQVRARLAPPAPASLHERLGKELGCALLKYGREREKYLRCCDAVLMVAQGAVFTSEGSYVVWDSQDATPYHLEERGPCVCDNAQSHADATTYYCVHQMALWFALKCDGLSVLETSAPDVKE